MSCRREVGVSSMPWSHRGEVYTQSKNKHWERFPSPAMLFQPPPSTEWKRSAYRQKRSYIRTAGMGHCRQEKAARA